jgi:tetratricopeptide (TPR) repeat protein
VRRRYLFGPAPVAFAEHNLKHARQSGDCLVFNREDTADLRIGPLDTWAEITARFPAGWQPDFVVLFLGYTIIPEGLWSAPVPLVSLAGDWNLLWHGYRRRLRRCDLILTDTVGAEVMVREGLHQARVARFFGGSQAFLEGHWPGCSRAFWEGPWPNNPRDIDILFIGNLHPAVQRERLAWLPQLARLSERWRVVIRTRVYGEDYRQLLARSRIVFNRSIRSECNPRVFETASAGALVFQEADNREIAAYLTAGKECVLYEDHNLEELLDYYLSHEEERRTLAEAARQRIHDFLFEPLWAALLALIDQELPALVDRCQRRPPLTVQENLLGRCWQALSSRAGDPTLTADLHTALAGQPGDAALHNALGVVDASVLPVGGTAAVRQAEASGMHFRRAWSLDAQHLVAGLNLAEALAKAGQQQPAAEQARRTLAALDRTITLNLSVLDSVHFPPVFDHFRVEWERAAWLHAGDPAGEAAAKRTLLRWRLHALLAYLTGNLMHAYEAALARPDLPPTRAALGQALLRAGHPKEAVEHLRCAVAADPFGADAARALFEAFGATGDYTGQQHLLQERRLLARAAPQVLRPEAWFTTLVQPEAKEGSAGTTSLLNTMLPPTGDPDQSGAALPRHSVPSEAETTRGRVSLCMIVKNEETNLSACLSSVVDLVDEIIVVDTGSSDRTKEVAARYGARIFDFPWCDSFSAARNAGLDQATGDWIFWLDGDEWLDEPNRQSFRTLLAGLKTENAVYLMKQQSRTRLTDEGGARTDQIRLFRRHPQVRWSYRVHEQLLPSVNRLQWQVWQTELVIQHNGYADLEVRCRKHERNLRLLLIEQKDQPQNAFILFNLAWTYYALGHVTEAIALFRQSLEHLPPRDSLERKLYVLLSQAQRRAGQQPEALATCRQGRMHYPDDPELVFAEGVLLQEAGDFAEAANCLRSLLVKSPGSYVETGVDPGLRGYRARHQLALIYREQKQDEQAEKEWQAVLTERPDCAEAWVGLADLYLAQKQTTAVERLLQRLETEPQRRDERAIVHARLCAFRQEFEQGRRLLEEALQRSPQRIALHMALSRLLLEENRDAAAIQNALHRVLSLDPAHSWARTTLTGFLGRSPTAAARGVEKRSQALPFPPLPACSGEQADNPLTLFHLGSVHHESGRHAEAVPFFRRSLACLPLGHSLRRKLYALLVNCYSVQGQVAEALVTCQEGCRQCPEATELLFLEAMLRRDQQDLKGAAASLQLLLETTAEVQFASVGLHRYQARQNLAVVYHQQGKLVEAEEQWQAVVAEQPDYLPAWRALGQLYLGQQRWAKVEETARQLDATASGQAEATALRAQAERARPHRAPPRP